MTVNPLASIESSLREILACTALFPRHHLTVDVIINPCAGAFSPQSRLDRVTAVLVEFTRGLVGTPRDPSLLEVRFHHTERPRHATEIVERLVGEQARGIRLIVSAGGDGTHGEVLSAAIHDSRLKGSGKGKVWFFRFPFGTGNDGADADTPARAARVLLGAAKQSAASHLIVRPAASEPMFGFNIASIGLDAYIALITNRLKGSVAGDLYKILADLLTLVYEPIVGTSRMTIRWSDGDGESQELTRRFAICVFGVSGERTYGDHKPILPGFENLCAVENVGLIGKVRLKSMIYRAEHVHSPRVHMRTANRLVVEYAARIPLQVDGETRWLTAEDFPLEIELFNDSVPVLRAE